MGDWIGIEAHGEKRRKLSGAGGGVERMMREDRKWQRETETLTLTCDPLGLPGGDMVPGPVFGETERGGGPFGECAVILQVIDRWAVCEAPGSLHTELDTGPCALQTPRPADTRQASGRHLVTKYLGCRCVLGSGTAGGTDLGRLLANRDGGIAIIKILKRREDEEEEECSWNGLSPALKTFDGRRTLSLAHMREFSRRVGSGVAGVSLTAMC
ncbi:hypothetical protein AAFF_G00085870 [Aldrovandia affinis]|uniref:Uncharacterized protein n=1 Tax=Aldrovandia affinis TaxID=143900 RepID=A0AAD7WCS7_9TELE|nr:hypothetical protein AAFF_G00085870 [Aldrovandia affinis]